MLAAVCCLQIHGFVCMAAVVVTDTLDWKLHGFDLTSEHALTGTCALSHHPVCDAVVMMLVLFLPNSGGCQGFVQHDDVR
jgi:hypothetical protein